MPLRTKAFVKTAIVTASVLHLRMLSRIVSPEELHLFRNIQSFVNMKMRRLLLSLLLCCSLSAFALTDEQVIAYIKQQTAAGKSEQQIGKELLAKGVTPEQANRIKAKLSKQNADTNTGTVQSNEQIDRRHTNNTNGNNNANGNNNTNNNNRNNYNNRTVGNNQNYNYNDVNQGNYNVQGNQDVEPRDYTQIDLMGPEKEIYGHQVFNSNSLITFEPSENLATPQNYRLGPGDEVIIDIWGTSEDHMRQTISPEGSIMISQIGPVFLNGMTISDANKHIKSAFSKKYAGMTDAETEIQVTLGQVRTIQVDIMGEVATPGTFRLSPFSSVFHALYNAGGINDIGSLRNIQVLRNGKKIAGVDIYDYLFNGKTSGNIRLQEGDVIIVPPYTQLVTIDGNVKRPMYYEIKPGETVQNLIDYSGGYTGDAYSGMVSLSRQQGKENELYNIEQSELASYRLKDGDIVTVGQVIDRYTNRVELGGAVNRPGMYALSNDIQTVGQLIRKAEGLSEEAYTERALLYRQGDNLLEEVIPIDLTAILEGRAADVELKRNDYLFVSNVKEIIDYGTLTIAGLVNYPGEYPYAKNMSVEDLVLQAGGLKDGASTARVDVARRIVNPDSTTPTEQLAENFSLSLNGKDASGDKFTLKPYDIVTVRQSPGYSPQEQVKIDGQLLFAGDYTIETRNERLSSFVRRAGGIIEGAYIKGAQLTRKLSEEEYKQRQETLRMAKMNQVGGDSIDLSKIEVSDHYSVGIDLEKALANPGSTYDVVMQPGDVLFVPEMQSTVKIDGEVMFPNAVVYVPGKKLDYYVDQAGGYGHQAKKGKAYIVYMNGSVARAKRNTPIEPGCQIVVPAKPANSGVDWTKVLALATSLGSVATMAATVANLFRK